MATYNGARFIDAQIESIERQTWPRIDVVVSDDGSTDGTLDRLRHWQTGWKKGTFRILKGPQQGFAANFRFLILLPDVEADFFAFADQDDIWRSDKMEIAVADLNRFPETAPSLFCGRTTLISSDGASLGVSPLFRRPPHFRNALVQNIAGGNTMVLNKAGWELVRRATEAATDFVSHDWWTYLIVTGSAGNVSYCATPLVQYRQHDGNIVGSNRSLPARVSRLQLLFAGRFSAWNAKNIAGLTSFLPYLTSDARQAIDAFSKARQGSRIQRLRYLFASQVYRQTFLGQISLIVGCLFGKI